MTATRPEHALFRFYRFERIGRRTILQLFNARPEDAPVCTYWERCRAREVPRLAALLEQRGILPLSAYHAQEVRP